MAMTAATTRDQLRHTVLGLFLCVSMSCGPGGGTGEAARGQPLEDISTWELVQDWVYSGSDNTAVRWIQDAAFLPGGQVLVATQDAFALALLDSSGQLLRSFGRKGEGPGEFLSLGRGSLAAYRGDSIAVYDYRSRRITVFSGSGEFGRVVLPAPWRDITVAVALLFRGALDDGRFLFLGRETILDAPRPEVYRPVEPLLAYAPDGTAPEALQFLPGREQYRAPNARSGPLALAREPLVASTGDGYYVGVSDSLTVRYVGSSVTREVSVPGSLIAPTAAEMRWERIRLRISQEQQFRGVPKELMANRLAYADEVMFPATKPTFDRLVASSAGELWLRLVSVLDDHPTADWLVFDGQGRPIGRVRLPRLSEVLASDGQRVLVQPDAATDDQVALYRVARTP